MTNWQRKVRPGDPLRFSATAYNKFVDAAIAVDTGRFAGPVPKTPAGDYVWARNEGTTDLEAFTPVRVTGVDSASVTRRDPRLVVEVGGSGTTTIQSRESFVVLQEPIRRGTIGRASASGWTWCKVKRPSSTTQYPPGTRLGLGIGQLVANSDGPAVVIEEGIGIPSQLTAMMPIRLGVGGGEFYARIGTSPTQDGTAARWFYAFAEVQWDGTNDEWDDVSGGRTSALLGSAVNTLEAGNTASSAYSVPVAGTNFEIGNTGVRFRPVPSGAVVRMRVTHDADFEPVVTFQAPNPVWGPCVALAELADSIGSQSDSGNPLPSAEEQESEETS